MSTPNRKVPDHRRSLRIPTNAPAMIAFNGGRSRVACVIRNISEGGAKLEVERLVRDIPQTFDLLVPGRPARACRVVWRALKELGISFSRD